MNNPKPPIKITELIKNAEAGDADAQFNLGLSYRYGKSIEQDYNKALTWYLKAAEQGHADAQNSLGTMYENGYGVEKNDCEAANWYRKSAEKNNASAQANLGSLYKHGRCVKQSDDEAIYWFRKAAANGSPRGQYNLGLMYRHARGVEQNYVEAVNWYRKAALQDYEAAQCNLGWMYQNGLGVKKSDRDAVNWYRKAAELDNAQAQYNLGSMYRNGRGIKQSDSDAVLWYEKAIKNGHAQAGISLGLMYMNGQGVDTDYLRARELFRGAATDSNADIHFKAIEYQDQAERYHLSPKITEIRKEILSILKANIKTAPTMTHYTSLAVGSALLLEKSHLRLGHINALNDPNEGKLLWRYLEHAPVEGKPAFVGCYLPDDDSLNMWRFYSKNHEKDDACGCAITFNTDDFFDFNLLPEPSTEGQQNDEDMAFSNSGKSPQESAAFYRIIYLSGNMNIHGDNKQKLEELFSALKEAVDTFLKVKPDNKKYQDLSRLLGPLPYLLKDADYEAEKEHRIIITHLEYGAKEIQSEKPTLENGVPPKLYLELHRTNHLDPVKHVTLGPKAPHQEMMIPYWHHKLMSDFSEQLKPKKDFYIRASKCAYQ
ncbi:hypothetical protein CF138_04580 [Aeromonas hydrophila]|nr:hypothetical protein CF138_04580 [Aeromonas hydrophila]TNI01009.1 hypothetical protein CF136_08735 [Aeromonas hydrophila]TNI98197.1 hypothetical protein CF118_05930 [Aeromonas hydrophila]